MAFQKILWLAIHAVTGNKTNSEFVCFNGYLTLLQLLFITLATVRRIPVSSPGVDVSERQPVHPEVLPLRRTNGLCR